MTAKVLVKKHDKDSDMIELYSVTKNGHVVWGVVHSDIIAHLKGGSQEAGGITLADLDNLERELTIV